MTAWYSIDMQIKTNRSRKIFLLLILLLLPGALSSCGVSESEEYTFIHAFDLDVVENEIELTELYNDYGGSHYEGIALYFFVADENIVSEAKEWDTLPYSDEVINFLSSIKNRIEFPDIENGVWKFVNRNERTMHLTNVSLCVYDVDAEIFYYLKMDI